MDSLAPTATSTCNCRVCGQPMHSITQKAGIPGRADVTYVTCWHDGCAMNGFTLDQAGYAERDLSAYIGHRPATAAALATCTTRQPGEKLFG